jgi:hypothetical protein
LHKYRFVVKRLKDFDLVRYVLIKQYIFLWDKGYSYSFITKHITTFAAIDLTHERSIEKVWTYRMFEDHRQRTNILCPCQITFWFFTMNRLNVQKGRELDTVRNSDRSPSEEMHTNTSAALPEITKHQYPSSNKLAQGR